MKEKKYYNVVHNILRVNSNCFFPGFKPGEVSNPDINIEVGNFSFSKEGLNRIDFWFFGKEGEDFIYFEDSFLGMKNKVLLNNISGKTEIRTTKSVPLLDRFYPPKSRQSLSELISTIIRVKLIQKGFLPVHAACLSKNNLTILLASFPQTGKTLSTLQLLNEGFEYISEDTVLVDRYGYAYLNPSSFTVHHDFLDFLSQKRIGSWKYYLIMFKTSLIKKNSFISRILKPPKINATKIIGNKKAKSKVNIACCLEIGNKKVREVAKDDLIKKILAINGYSLPKMELNPFLWTYSYFNNYYIQEIFEREKENLFKFLEGCDCFLLSCDDKNWGSVFKEVMVTNEP